jgi:hypothetical protein
MKVQGLLWLITCDLTANQSIEILITVDYDHMPT